MSEYDSDAQVTLNAGTALAGPQYVTPNGKDIPLIVVPEGYKIASPDPGALKAYLKQPLRKVGEFRFTDVDSFIRYFNEQKDDQSRIFASITDATIKFSAILNFHGDAPSWNDHYCFVNLLATREFTIWTAANKKEMTQCEFAQFLEENTDLFREPSGLSLLELVQSLEGKSHVDITQAIKMQTGALRLNFTETVELKGGTSTAEGSLDIPTKLKVGIAPFIGVSAYEMTARLRYRVSNRKITFWYETVDSHLVVRAVAADLVKVITTQTGLVPFNR